MAESSPLVNTYGHYINGQWAEPDSGRYDVCDPTTEEVIATAPDASVAQVEQAIAAARAAFDSGPWAAAEPAERSRCLQQLSDALLARGEEVYALAQAEWGCTENERLIHVEGPAFMVGHAAELEFRPAGEDMDEAGRGVAAEQGALRTAQHLDPVDLAELVEADARARAVDPVDEHRD